MKTHLDEMIPGEWRDCLSAYPGWWFWEPDADRLIRVVRSGRRFIASSFHRCDEDRYGRWRTPKNNVTLGGGQSVIGTYPTVEAARAAAVARHGTGGKPLCSWADVERTRKELAAARAAKAEVPH